MPNLNQIRPVLSELFSGRLSLFTFPVGVALWIRPWWCQPRMHNYHPQGTYVPIFNKIRPVLSKLFFGRPFSLHFLLLPPFGSDPGDANLGCTTTAHKEHLCQIWTKSDQYFPSCFPDAFLFTFPVGAALWIRPWWCQSRMHNYPLSGRSVPNLDKIWPIVTELFSVRPFYVYISCRCRPFRSTHGDANLGCTTIPFQEHLCQIWTKSDQ